TGRGPVERKGRTMWIAFDLNYDGYTDSWGWDGDRNGLVEQLWVNNDGDGDYEAVIYDQNEDGRAEWMWIDADNNGSFDALMDDHDGDGRMGDYVLFDLNHDGRFEAATWDPGEDGFADLVARDTNGDGHADTWYQHIPAQQVQRQPTAIDLALQRMMFDHNT